MTYGDLSDLASSRDLRFETLVQTRSNHSEGLSVQESSLIMRCSFDPQLEVGDLEFRQALGVGAPGKTAHLSSCSSGN